MLSQLQYYLSLPYTRVVVPDEYSEGGACYVARIEELPGCETHGDSAEEAIANLREAIEIHLAAMLEDGVEPPVPTNSAPTSAVWVTVPAAEPMVPFEGPRAVPTASLQAA
jgi:predicted RNase H-like HicB family nuclease